MVLNNCSCPSRANAFPSSSEKVTNSLISAPAINAFSPAPIITIQRTFLLASKSKKQALNSAIVCLFNAFKFSGRFTVRTAILSL